MKLYTDGNGHFFRYAAHAEVPKHLTLVEPSEPDKGKDGKGVKPATKQAKPRNK